MDSKQLIKNKPSLDLALFAVNTIYHPNEEMDWIHVNFLPYLSNNKSLKCFLKVFNPSFDSLPPVRIQLTLEPLKFNIRDKGYEKITTCISEYLIVDSLPDNGEVEYEVFTNNHSALLKIPCILTINCLPYFNSNDDSDWHSPPLYTTVLTELDLLLTGDEMNEMNVNPTTVPLSADAIASIDITDRQAMKLISKEMKDIKDVDILQALFHYRYSKIIQPFEGHIFMNDSLIEVKVTAAKVVPRKPSAAFEITILAHPTACYMLRYQLMKKLEILWKEDAFPVQRPSRPSTVIWKPTKIQTQNFDCTHMEE